MIPERKDIKTVLVVDDDPDIRESIKMVLEVNGYNVITAIDGDQCLEKLNETKPDLILLDIMMPGTPFMSIVRKSDMENRGLCAQDNVVDFFQKPFNVRDMVNKIERILEGEKTL